MLFAQYVDFKCHDIMVLKNHIISHAFHLDTKISAIHLFVFPPSIFTGFLWNTRPVQMIPVAIPTQCERSLPIVHSAMLT